MIVSLCQINIRGSSFVQLRPQIDPLDIIKGILASLRFEDRRMLDQLGIEISLFDIIIAVDIY